MREHVLVRRFAAALATLEHLLGRARIHAAERGLSEEAVLEWRLAPDMYTLRQQAKAVIDLAQQWAARAAGLEVPAPQPAGQDLNALLRAAGDARNLVDGVTEEQLAANADKEITMDLGPVSPIMPAARWLVGFANTNLHFHLSIAYGILRANGVPLGKSDLFAGGL